MNITVCVSVNVKCESQEFILHVNNNNNEGFRFDCGIV